MKTKSGINIDLIELARDAKEPFSPLGGTTKDVILRSLDNAEWEHVTVQNEMEKSEHADGFVESPTGVTAILILFKR